MPPLEVFPVINAWLNALSAFFLFCGWIAVRNLRVRWHGICMLAAFSTSIIFLTSYLYYHFHHKVTRFAYPGWPKAIYFTILISHTILAMAVVPLVLTTLWAALTRRWERHRALARWTWPIWMYVSITGVVIYWMLYQWWPSPK